MTEGYEGTEYMISTEKVYCDMKTDENRLDCNSAPC